MRNSTVVIVAALTLLHVVVATAQTELKVSPSGMPSIIDASGTWRSANGKQGGTWAVRGAVDPTSDRNFSGTLQLQGLPKVVAAEVEGRFDYSHMHFATLRLGAAGAEDPNAATAFDAALSGLTFDATLAGVRLDGTFSAAGVAGVWKGWWTTRKDRARYLAEYHRQFPHTDRGMTKEEAE